MQTDSPTPASPSLLLSLPEVCKETRLGKRKVWELSHSGELPIVRVGRRVLVPRAGLEAWIEANTQGGGR
jgi:excisionase family DNA binding protein